MGRKSGEWTRPEQKYRRFPPGTYPVDHCLALRQDWRKGCCVFCPSRSVERTANKGHHLGICLQSHHIGLLELLTPQVPGSFQPSTPEGHTSNHKGPLDTKSAGEPEPMSEQNPEATNSNGLSVLHHPQKDPLTQTKSFRTSWDLCFLWENLTGPERGTSGSTIGAEALARHRTHA